MTHQTAESNEPIFSPLSDAQKATVLEQDRPWNEVDSDEQEYLDSLASVSNRSNS